MNEGFVPPKEAKQFHATKNDAGKPVDIWVWVMPMVPRYDYRGPDNCKCKMLYPVVMQSVTRDAKDQGAKTWSYQHFVCDCHGRLVP